MSWKIPFSSVKFKPNSALYCSTSLVRFFGNMWMDSSKNKLEKHLSVAIAFFLKRGRPVCIYSLIYCLVKSIWILSLSKLFSIFYMPCCRNFNLYVFFLIFNPIFSLIHISSCYAVFDYQFLVIFLFHFILRIKPQNLEIVTGSTLSKHNRNNHLHEEGSKVEVNFQLLHCGAK